MFSYHVLEGSRFSRPLFSWMDYTCFMEIWNLKRWSIVACGLSRKAFAFARGWKAAWSRSPWAISCCIPLRIRSFAVWTSARGFRDDKTRFSLQRRRRASRWIESVPIATGPRSRRARLGALAPCESRFHYTGGKFCYDFRPRWVSGRVINTADILWMPIFTLDISKMIHGVFL